MGMSALPPKTGHVERGKRCPVSAITRRAPQIPARAALHISAMNGAACFPALLRGSFLRCRPTEAALLKVLLEEFPCLGQQVVDRWIVAEEADLELRRILDQLLHVVSRCSHDPHHGRDVAVTWCRD
jgi:hypothetical protein